MYIGGEEEMRITFGETEGSCNEKRRKRRGYRTYLLRTREKGRLLWDKCGYEQGDDSANLPCRKSFERSNDTCAIAARCFRLVQGSFLEIELVGLVGVILRLVKSCASLSSPSSRPKLVSVAVANVVISETLVAAVLVGTVDSPIVFNICAVVVIDISRVVAALIHVFLNSHVLFILFQNQPWNASAS